VYAPRRARRDLGPSRARTQSRQRLCLGSRLTGSVVALEALEAWLNATPAEGRHVARIAKIDELDGHLVDDERYP